MGNEHPVNCTCPDCCEENGYIWSDGELVPLNEDNDRTNETRVCLICNKEKDISEFHKYYGTGKHAGREYHYRTCLSCKNVRGAYLKFQKAEKEYEQAKKAYEHKKQKLLGR